MYSVGPVGDDILAAIDSLPVELLGGFAELRAALELSPTTVGTPLVPSNPDGLRVATFGVGGTGQVVFHVLRRERRVAVVQLVFL